MEPGQVGRGTCIQAGRCVSSPLHPLRRDLMHVMAHVMASMTRIRCVFIKGRGLPASVYTSTRAHEHTHGEPRATGASASASSSAGTRLNMSTHKLVPQHTPDKDVSERRNAMQGGGASIRESHLPSLPPSATHAECASRRAA